jgi:hypothetical protein
MSKITFHIFHLIRSEQKLWTFQTLHVAMLMTTKEMMERRETREQLIARSK